MRSVKNSGAGQIEISVQIFHKQLHSQLNSKQNEKTSNISYSLGAPQTAFPTNEVAAHRRKTKKSSQWDM